MQGIAWVKMGASQASAWDNSFKVQVKAATTPPCPEEMQVFWTMGHQGPIDSLSTIPSTPQLNFFFTH